MPTILTHPVVPLAIGLGLGSGIVPRRLLVAGIVASIIPDFDVISFRLGVPYESAFGHRGFTHSLTFALAIACLGALAHRALKAHWLVALAFLLVAGASHGVLDSFTNGGSGVAFLWPWSDERFFAAFQVIEVSPIGVSRFFTARGATVFASELLWVWLPGFFLALLIWGARKKLAPDFSRT